MPDKGWCECVAPTSPTACQGSDWVHFDSCGAVAQSEACPTGCVDNVGCCGEGTHAESGSCVPDVAESMPDVAEPMPEAGDDALSIDVPAEDEMGQVADEAELQHDAVDVVQMEVGEEAVGTEPAPDLAVEFLGPDVGPGGTGGSGGGGCSSTGDGGRPALAVILIAAAAIFFLASRRRRTS